PKDGATARMDKGEIIITKTSAPMDADLAYRSFIMEKVKALALFGRPIGKKDKREKGEVKLNFTLSRDGSLIDGPHVTQTTNAALDLPALEAIRSASPFQPFPAAITKDKETFSIFLSYE
ncbi:MAG: energy transducer TonB, partial [Candidatus Omnitrophota bacterium]